MKTKKKVSQNVKKQIVSTSIKAIINGVIVECIVGGSKLEYPRVFLPDGGYVEAAWATLEHVIATKSALSIS